LLEDMILKALQ